MPSDLTMSFNYPKVERNETLIEEHFGVNVADPYRALEDPDAEVTKKFVKELNEVTDPYLNKCPHRANLKKILTANQDYEKYGCPFKRGNKYYFFKNSGLQPQSVLYQRDTLDSEPKVFFDPNTLSEDGTVALSITAFSPNGQYFAYGLSSSGSDWIEIGVKDVQTGNDINDKLKRIKFSSIEWTHDNKGFFYAQYPVPEDGKEVRVGGLAKHSIYYHVLNTDQTDDVLKVNHPDPKYLLGFEVSTDGKYLHVSPSPGCDYNSWYYSELDKLSSGDKLDLKPLYEKMDAKLEYLANNGDIVYFRTNLGAQNYRIAKLDIKNPACENWVDVIPNHESDVLEGAEVYTVGGKDYILVTFLRKVVYYLELHELEGGVVKKFDLPLGTISKYSGRRNDNEIFFMFTSFLTPGQNYHYDLRKLDVEPKIVSQSKPKNFDANEFTISQVFYQSKDKTEIPMFIVHKKSLVKDGKQPCLLYGYGGFNIQITPGFNSNRVPWLKNFNGVLAVANLRGGGEFGKKWHDSGRLLNKQNTFDDFIAAGEYLIKNNYTNRDKLAIEGHSNGGLLVAAVSNQRPDLFGATICGVGVLDMIRYHSFTIGHAWITDYGNPEEKEHFENLYKYSPYHNIPITDRYPSILIATADHDDRVVPAHSLKFIAELQHKLGEKLPNTPLLAKVDTKAGHGAGKPVAKVIDQYTDMYSFLYNALDLESSFKDN